MAITSQASRYSRIGEVIIQNWKAGGLLKASTIKPILTTIEKSLIFRKLGGLDHSDLQRLTSALETIIG